MNTTKRGPQRDNTAPFLMRLERLCQLIEKGAEVTIEFNPCSDIPAMLGHTMDHVHLRIHEGGDVSVHAKNDTVSFNLLGLTLANYKRLWRCWQNGNPTEAQRRTTPWGRV